MISLALLVVAILYARGWYRLQHLYPDLLNTRRMVTFFAGLFALWVAVGSRLAGMDHLWLTAHMAQHLLLMTVAAPLILLGAPVITLVHGLPRRFVGGALEVILRHPFVQQPGRLLTRPLFCWLMGPRELTFTASQRPSGLNKGPPHGRGSSGKSWTRRPVGISQSLIVPEVWEPVTTHRPSGLTAIPRASRWGRMRRELVG